MPDFVMISLKSVSDWVCHSMEDCVCASHLLNAHNMGPKYFGSHIEVIFCLGIRGH